MSEDNKNCPLHEAKSILWIEEGASTKIVEMACVDLPEERKVTVARCSDGSSALEFVSRKGEITRVGISLEASVALLRLLLEVGTGKKEVQVEITEKT